MEKAVLWADPDLLIRKGQKTERISHLDHATSVTYTSRGQKAVLQPCLTIAGRESTGVCDVNGTAMTALLSCIASDATNVREDSAG